MFPRKSKNSFKENELVLLLDNKERRYLITLKKGAVFHFHQGFIPHDEIMKKEEGETILSSQGKKLLLFRPGWGDYTLKMKRGAQIIYPKDMAQILVLADIFPGAKVFEVGMGSGASTIALLRAIGRKGTVVSYEIREDFFKIAQRNIERFSKGKKEEWGKLVAKLADVEKGIKEKGFDRAIIDLAEPWRILDRLKKAVRNGGIIVFYLPTVMQIYHLVEEIEKNYHEDFYLSGIYENLVREWRKAGLSLRPRDRMVAHTGFIIIAKKLKQGGEKK